MKNKELIFFDLGNVLLDFDHYKTMEIIAKKMTVSKEALEQFLLASGLFFRHEEGLISSEDLLGKIEKRFECPCLRQYFEAAYDESFKMKQDVFTVVLELTKTKRLALLSNLGEISKSYIEKKLPLFEPFEKLIFSFEAKALKPKKEIYRYALNAVKLPPEKCYFIDDLEENIAAAKEEGIDGFVFRGQEDLIRHLQ